MVAEKICRQLLSIEICPVVLESPESLTMAFCVSAMYRLSPFAAALDRMQENLGGSTVPA